MNTTHPIISVHVTHSPQPLKPSRLKKSLGAFGRGTRFAVQILGTFFGLSCVFVSVSILIPALCVCFLGVVVVGLACGTLKWEHA